MFSVEEYNKEVACKTLEHSANVFHEALADGDKYYHVHHANGADYDILYKGNTEWFGDMVPSYVGKIVPEFLTYDEDDESTMDITYLKAHSKFIILKLTEYSIAVARAVLRFTDKPVYFMDPRVLWFLETNDRLHIGEMPEEDEKTLFLVGPLGHGYVRGEVQDNKKSDIFVFDNVFIMQDILQGRKKEEVKYLYYPLAKASVGIGGLLIQTSLVMEYARQMGWKLTYDGDTIGKFKISDLNKYFKIDFSRPDATEENTISMPLPYLNTLWRFYSLPGALSDDVLQEKFHEELNEYAEAIIAGRKVLGVLIRGTDYKTVGFTGGREQATVDDMLPTLKEWMNEENYEVIFLATEDQDVLNQMREAFGKKVVAIAQERHSVSEFEKGQIINELEKQLYAEDEYDNRIIENTINYFYALYLLSKCNAFMCSGQNNGWDTVNAMNAGKFEKAYKFNIGINSMK